MFNQERAYVMYGITDWVHDGIRKRLLRSKTVMAFLVAMFVVGGGVDRAHGTGITSGVVQENAHGLRLTKGWVRTSQGPNSAAFMHIHNDGDQDDDLIAANSAIAATTELHTHIKEGNVYKMRPISAIKVAAGSKTTLKPGGLHIMLMHIKQPIQLGDLIPIDLTFRSGRTMTVTLMAKDKQCMCAGNSKNPSTKP